MKRLIAVALLFVAPALYAENLFDYVDRRAGEVLKDSRIQRAEQNQTTSKQVTAPAGTSTDSLLDETSAADLFSAAFKMASVAKGSGEKSGLAGGSATAFALLAAFRGTDPLDPKFYNDNTAWRKVSFAIGTEAAADGKSETKTYQLKWRIFDGREVTRKENAHAVSNLLAFNIPANVKLGDATNAIKQLILQDSKVKDAVKNVAKSPIAKDDDIPRADIDWDRLPQDIRSQFDQFILPAAEAIAALDDAAAQFIADVRAKPQFALALTLKQPPTGGETYVSEFIYDQGMGKTNFSLTGNLAAELTRSATNSHDNTYRGSLRSRYEIKPAKVGTRGAYFDLTGEASRHTGDPNIFKAQGKLTFPISGGVDLPISVTWANRKDLIQESRITGHIGFTIDFSKLTELIHSK